MKRFAIPARIGVGAVLWGVVLVFAWAIHPVESAATYEPVRNPTPAEQASIDDVFEASDGPRPVLSNRLQCASSPLQVATGDGGASPTPPIPEGFEYVEPACTSAYHAASAAFWINLIVIGAVVALCVTVHLGLRRREPEASEATTDAAEAHIVR